MSAGDKRAEVARLLRMASLHLDAGASLWEAEADDHAEQMFIAAAQCLSDARSIASEIEQGRVQCQ